MTPAETERRAAEMFGGCACAKNFPLLWKVYDHIVAHPEEWSQELFVGTGHCGTTFCFAGHAVAIGRPDLRFMLTSYGDGYFVDKRGDHVSAGAAAARVLGLSQTERDDLFRADNDLPAIRALIAGWEAEAAS